MGKLSPEEVEKNIQSVNKTKKICLIIFIVAAAGFVAFFIIKSISGGKKKPELSFEVVSSSEYARDGKKCKAYRVYVESKPSAKEAREIFEYVTDDSYYLHTVWFFRTKSAASGSGSADWTMEQAVQGVTPQLK